MTERRASASVSVDWKEQPGSGGCCAVRTPAFNLRSMWGSGRSRGAPVAAALHNASVVLSGGEGQWKPHTGASSSQIIVEGVGETRADTQQRGV